MVIKKELEYIGNIKQSYYQKIGVMCKKNPNYEEP